MRRHDDRTEHVPASPADAVTLCPSVDVAPARDAAEIAAIAALAREIWLEFYEPLIGRAQIEYMLGRFQSAEAITAQLREGYAYYVVRRSGRPVGYCAVQPAAGALFLSKLYLRRDERGAKVGRALLRFVEQLALERGLASVWLTVNKRNPSVRIYERLGFRITADVCTDIGAGYVMDDHRMEKALPDPARESTGSS